MQIARTKQEIQDFVSKFKEQNKTIGFVPTMGALHQGHLSLVDIAASNSDIVVVSIFVNPKQFAPHEDFDQYPRNEKDDLDKLKDRQVDIVYLPSAVEIYPENFSQEIQVGEIGKILEGMTRPHFFDGVATVVAELLHQVNPDVAVFGEKDFQQLTIIKKMVKDQNLKVKIIGGKIIREQGGLAMSSRNQYLSDNKRLQANNIFRILQELREQIKSGQNINQVIDSGKEKLIDAGFDSVDYLQLIREDNLANINSYNSEINSRLVIAAYMGKTRLLDNLRV